MEQWASAPMRSTVPLIYCSRFCVFRAFCFQSIGALDNGTVGRCANAVYCSTDLLFPLLRSPGVFISLRSIALLFVCSRFSVPLISTVSIGQDFFVQGKRGGECLVDGQAPLR